MLNETIQEKIKRLEAENKELKEDVQHYKILYKEYMGMFHSILKEYQNKKRD